MGLESRAPLRQLSGGQEQRVAIARAIVTGPLLLVAGRRPGDLDRTRRRGPADLCSNS
ncbi:MAG: ATP-binding cassette domain-containing protein [Isosphaeraceae bacterium]